jgi:tetratricopeptide (TPR) repeat protein
MKNILFTLSLLMIGVKVFAFNADSVFVQANTAYLDEDYETAIQKYMELVSNDFLSSDLYYNLGNTYYKSNEIGETIWAYENAHKINPADEDINFNLQFVNDLTVDKISIDKKGIGSWLNKNIFSFSPNFWFVISVSSGFIIAFLLYLFFIPTSHLTNNLSLLGVAILGIIFLSSIAFSIVQKKRITGQTKVVVIESSANVLTEPNEDANTSFQLHEGAQMNIKSKNNQWYEVELNGNTGWVNKNSVWVY